MASNSPEQEPISVFVAAETSSKQLATSLHQRYKDGDFPRVVVKAMGAHAVNVAVKGIVELNKLLAAMGHYAVMVPALEEFYVPDPMAVLAPRTHVVIRLYVRALGVS